VLEWQGAARHERASAIQLVATSHQRTFELAVAAYATSGSLALATTTS